MFKERQLQDIEGASGGKGGGGGGPSEANDTLITNEVVKILNLLGEGEVNLYTGDGRSIFLNNVPLQNSDGSYNFGNYDQATGDSGLYTGGGSTYWEYRNGSPTQTPMTNPAFPSASAIISVNEEATGGTTVPLVAPAPVVYSVSNADIDYCVVAIQFPNGLENVDGNGNIIGDSVNITLDVKPHTSSTWVNFINVTINAKSSEAATVQYQVNNPSSGNLWDIRFSRITPDNSTSTRKNQCYLYDVEEVQQVTLPYNNMAYCGLALNAATIGGSYASIPTMSFLVSKGPIQIPSNYNPATWTFTGLWNGTFTTGVTDDPAWILYDAMTNTQYGGGLYGITPAMIDKYSFYNASVFNNILVSNGAGGTEPRFTFNAPLQNRQDMLTSFQQIAGMMNAALGMTNGLITLFQDRPTASSYLVTKSNAIQSDDVSPNYFTYTSTASTDRTTACIVTWTNASNLQYLPTTSSVSDATGLARYGYQSYDLSAFGATTEGQAQRAGRMYLYTALYNTQQVEFKTGLEGFLYNLYDVFDLYDDDYAGTAVGGRIVSATGNTVTLDQPVVIASGVTSKVSVWLQDGVTYESHTITNSPGTYTTLNISGTWSTTPTRYCTYGVTSAVAPRQFRIMDLKYDGVTKEVDVTAQLYNSNNYTYAETGTTVPTPVYSTTSQVAPLAPTNLVCTGTQYIDVTTNTVSYGVNVTWTRPVAQNVGYILMWRKDNGPYTTLPQFQINSFELSPIVNGTYDFLVYSVSVAGNKSPPATVSFTQSNTGGTTSATLTELTNLQVTGVGGSTWSGLDLPVTWTNPAANQGLLKDFVLTFSTTGGALLRSVVVAGVAGGSAQNYVYTYAMNEADGGGTPNRSVVVKVQGQDSSNNTTNGISGTFTNPAPPVPSNISASPALQSAIIQWTPETATDIAGYIVWYSTTSGFTPSSANGIDIGNTALAALNGLVKSTTYYYKVAAYDVFGKSLAGTGLNLSSQLSFLTPSNVGTPSGSSLPTSGMLAGDTFWLTTTATLYQYTGSAWAPVGVVSVSSLPATGAYTGQVLYDTTTSILDTWNGSAWTAAVSGSSIITGSITTALLAAGSVTTSKIAAGAITTATLASGSVTTSILAAGAVVASTIAVSTLSAISANVGTLTAGLISNNSGTNTINLSATGTTAFISTPGLSILANGTATFSGTLSGAIVSAGNINVSTLSAITANVGTLTAGTIQNSSGSVSMSLTNGLIVLNNGTTMSLKGEGFGASSQFLEWSGPTQSSASNYVACTTSNATSYLTTSGASYFGGNINMELSGISGQNGYLKHPPSADGTVIIEQWGFFTQGSSSPNTVSFNITFPHNCMNVTIANCTGTQDWWVGTVSTTGFQWNFGAAGYSIFWRAIGY